MVKVFSTHLRPVKRFALGCEGTRLRVRLSTGQQTGWMRNPWVGRALWAQLNCPDGRYHLSEWSV